MEEAAAVYQELGRNYGQLWNNAGHPYGLLSEFQLCEINKSQKGEEQYLKSVLNLYRQINQGQWPVSRAVFDFYTAELETVLSVALKESKYAALQNIQLHFSTGIYPVFCFTYP